MNSGSGEGMIPKMKKDRRTRDQETECQNNARNEGQNVCICIWDEKRDKVDSADRASDEKRNKHDHPYPPKSASK
jgi:hypothetical protein